MISYFKKALLVAAIPAASPGVGGLAKPNTSLPDASKLACFGCTTDYGMCGGPSVPCHIDYNDFFNSFAGEQPHWQWVYGSCHNWHSPYRLASDRLKDERVVAAADEMLQILRRGGSDDELLQALTKHDEARLNSKRSAIQVVAATGEIVMHVPLSHAQTVRLAALISSRAKSSVAE